MVGGHLYESGQIFVIWSSIFFSLNGPLLGYSAVHFHKLSNFSLSSRPVLYMIVHFQAWSGLRSTPKTGEGTSILASTKSQEIAPLHIKTDREYLYKLFRIIRLVE